MNCKRKISFLTGSILSVGPKNPECESIWDFAFCF